MRRFAGLSLLALLAACAGTPRPVLIDVRRAPPPPRNEGAPNESIQDIADAIKKGELPPVRFESDSDVLTLDSRPTLDRIARVLMSSAKLKLLIRAYTDDTGDEAYNLDLSQRRAQAVKAYLASKGVAPPSVRCRGYGAQDPIGDNDTEEGRAKNRRVEFRVTTREWNAVY
ncbi:MAG: OmpA family protein [Elusimicrobia bacterium]|nr:OmpA family protein [Elusimicrobiota bacterium]